MKRSFEAGDLDGYADVFVPALRAMETRRAADLRDTFGMKSVLFRVADRIQDPDGRERVFLQVFFQNELSAMLENWQVVARPAGRRLAHRREGSVRAASAPSTSSACPPAAPCGPAGSRSTTRTSG